MADEGTIRSFNPNITKSLLEIRQQFQRLYTLVPPSVYGQTGPAPGGSDDITKGWRVGSRMFFGPNTAYRAIPGNENAPRHTIFECSSNNEGAAVWQEMAGTSAVGESGGVAGSSELVGAVDYLSVHSYGSGRNVRVILDELVAAGGGARAAPIVFIALADEADI